MDSVEILSALEGLGLLCAGEAVDLRPLAGGVSSDIFEVSTPTRRFCVKRALPRLKVAAVWEAPVGRNAAEADWMRAVGGWLPGGVPKILGEDRGRGLFAMEFLPPDTHPVWKSGLMAGVVDRTFAEAVGRDLAAIHGRSAGAPDLARAFDNHGTFESIRMTPYLRATARAHPALADRLNALADRTLGTRLALVHGDVSPKNILHGPQSPVFLDAECACWGDPAFDLAFCLNHLLLKGAWRRDLRDRYLGAFSALARAYLAGVSWEDPAGLERRASALLPALFLARVDGTSPAEYLQDEGRHEVRTASLELLRAEPSRLAPIADHWSRARA